MPNHVTTIIEIKDAGDTDIRHIRSCFLNESGSVDFNVIIPRPECLNDFSPHMGIIGTAEALMQSPLSDNELIRGLEKHNRANNLARYKDFNEEDRRAVERAIKNYKECGFFYWHDWASDAWETKWNAYGQPENGFDTDVTEYTFETAWAHPRKLVELASTRLPNVRLHVKYADEDTGSNCGQYEIVGGKHSLEDIAPRWGDQTIEQKRKYTELAFNIRYPNENPRAHGYDENWEYSDDTYEEYEAAQEA